MEQGTHSQFSRLATLASEAGPLVPVLALAVALFWLTLRGGGAAIPATLPESPVGRPETVVAHPPLALRPAYVIVPEARLLAASALTANDAALRELLGEPSRQLSVLPAADAEAAQTLGRALREDFGLFDVPDVIIVAGHDNQYTRE